MNIPMQLYLMWVLLGRRSHLSFQSRPECLSLPAQLATPGRGRDDETPCMAAEWPAEWEESSTPSVIGRRNSRMCEWTMQP